MAEPLVSVVMPVRDAERFIGAAIESVLEQDHRAVEVVVVDDGSTDGSVEVARRHPVRALESPERGIAHARNAGVAAARGELIAFLDADDVWLAGTLRPRVELLARRPDVDAVIGRMLCFVEPGAPRPPWYQREWETEPQSAYLGGVMVRRGVFEAIGTFDTSFEVGEDTDWLARLKDSGLGVAHVPDVIYRYRHHDHNTCHRRELIGPALLRIMRASVHRQRAGEAAIADG